MLNGTLRGELVGVARSTAVEHCLLGNGTESYLAGRKSCRTWADGESGGRRPVGAGVVDCLPRGLPVLDAKKKKR